MSKKKIDPNRPRQWHAILKRIPENKEITGAEVGVWQGRTSLELLKAREMLHHIMVDPWQAPDHGSSYAMSPDSIAKNEQPYFDECHSTMLESVGPYMDRVTIYRLYSHQAAGLIKDKALDYVFIDAEHTYKAVMQDIRLWLPKVKEGGWIGGHDYGNLPRFPGVHEAVNDAFGDSVELDVNCTWFHWIKGL